MAAAYSKDLRMHVLKDSDAGLPSKELAERYHVSRAWVDALTSDDEKRAHSRHSSRRHFGGER